MGDGPSKLLYCVIYSVRHKRYPNTVQKLEIIYFTINVDTK